MCLLRFDKNSDLNNSANQKILLTIFTAFMQLLDIYVQVLSITNNYMDIRSIDLKNDSLTN